MMLSASVGAGLPATWPQAWRHEPERPGPDARSLRTTAKEGWTAAPSMSKRFRV